MKKLTEEEYQVLIKAHPAARIGEQTGHILNDTINGILVAYSKRVIMRDGWIDLITNQDAVREIEELINDHCDG